MREAEAAPATAMVDRVNLCFALGRALEDRGGGICRTTWLEGGF
jgi:hypothetical protein